MQNLNNKDACSVRVIRILRYIVCTAVEKSSEDVERQRPTAVDLVERLRSKFVGDYRSLALYGDGAAGILYGSLVVKTKKRV